MLHRCVLLALTLGSLGVAWNHGRSVEQEKKALPAHERFEMKDLLKKLAASKSSYLSFLDRPTLSSGIYRLPAGSVDRQSPHSQDEIYYVLEGEASFTVGKKTMKAAPGDVLFVVAGAEHRFHDIKKDLTLLVFFSKAKTRKKGGKAAGK